MRDVEQVLASQREEALWEIEGREKMGRSARLSWFNGHRGHIEMAYVMGLISTERYEELLSEWGEHYPAA